MTKGWDSEGFKKLLKEIEEESAIQSKKLQELIDEKGKLVAEDYPGVYFNKALKEKKP